MNTPQNNPEKKDEKEKKQTTNAALSNDAKEEDDSPVLDENDLEENHLSVEEADNAEWDESSKSK